MRRAGLPVATTGTAAARLLLRRSRWRRLRPSALDLAAYGVGASILVTLLLSAARSASDVQPSAIAAVSPRVAVVVTGAVVVAALLAAVTSGARGGPLALPAAMVMIVMLAPIDRSAVLRFQAARQVVVAAVAGALVAEVAWIATATQLGSSRASPVAWLVTGALAGTACAGASLLGAGMRISSRASAVLRTLLVVWWGADAAFDKATSPMAALARLPFDGSTGAAAYAAAVAVGVALLGVATIGGLSLEKAWRRAGSADQLRIAVGLNDLRTAVLILRRRGSEAARGRPWWRVDGRWTHRHPIATRSTRALLRWPLSRIGRLALLAVAAGFVAAASVQQLALGVVASVFAYAGSLDAVDALAQELDHPDLQRSFPMAEESLALRHLGIPLAVMTGFSAIASGVAGLLGGMSSLTAGLVVSPLVGLAAVAGAALTATRAARPLTKITDIGLPPEAVAPRIITRVVAPIVPLLATILPVVGTVDDGRLPDTVLAALPGGTLSLITIAFVVHRTRLQRLAVRFFVLRVQR
jgi:hypothetical protein